MRAPPLRRRNHSAPAEPTADPFRERERLAYRERAQLLGARFRFETDSPQLRDIVRRAYAGLPAHALSGLPPRCLVRLTLAPTQQSRSTRRAAGEPPRAQLLAAGDILCGTMGGANFVALTPQQRSALISVSPEIIGFPYHVRYELLEFAVYLLAARAQDLVPLHAACIGRSGHGILLLGPSGSGKSTVSLHCALRGLDFLAEDSVLIKPDGLLATGVSNFLHIRRDSLRFLDGTSRKAVLGTSSIIRRRSGVEKLEIDLRSARYRLAPAPLRIGASVFVSRRSAATGALLVPMRAAELTRALVTSQRYAAGQPGWRRFLRDVSRLPAFELRRGRHPLQAVEALEGLLPPRPKPAGRKGEQG